MIRKTDLVAPIFYTAIVMATVAGYFLDKKIFVIFLLALFSAIFLLIYEKIHLYVFITMIGSKVKPVSLRLLLMIALVSLLVASYIYFNSHRITDSGAMLGITIYTLHAMIRKTVLRQVV